MGFVNEYEQNWPWRILLIEDNPADEKMVRKSLIKHDIKCDLLVLDDGLQAMEFFDALEASSHKRCPDIVLLDIGLPHHDGLEILRRVRAGNRCGQTPVIVMTGSEAAGIPIEAAKNAAKYFFQKTADYEAFLELGRILKEILNEEFPAPSAEEKH